MLVSPTILDDILSYISVYKVNVLQKLGIAKLKLLYFENRITITPIQCLEISNYTSSRGMNLEKSNMARFTGDTSINVAFVFGYQKMSVCYGRPLLQPWLLPDLNTIPNNCVRDNSLELSGYGIGFWCLRSLLQIPSEPYTSAMHFFICFFVTDFVRKIGARQDRPLSYKSHLMSRSGLSAKIGFLSLINDDF